MLKHANPNHGDMKQQVENPVKFTVHFQMGIGFKVPAAVNYTSYGGEIYDKDKPGREAIDPDGDITVQMGQTNHSGLRITGQCLEGRNGR